MFSFAAIVVLTACQTDAALPSAPSVTSPAIGTQTALLLQEGFEGTPLKTFFPVTCRSHSFTVSHSLTRSGSSSGRIELRRTDPVAGNSYRAELRLTQGSIVGGVGQERWYGLSIYVPGDWRIDTNPRDWQILAQWHSLPDVQLGEGLLPPPLAIWIDKGEWSIWSYWDRTPVTKTTADGAPLPPGGRAVLWRGPYSTGKWTDWVVHAQWSYLSDGLIEMWKDGVKVVSRRGPNTYNDTQPLYFMLGLYRWPWSFPNNVWSEPKRVVYFDELRVGDATANYSAVVPR